MLLRVFNDAANFGYFCWGFVVIKYIKIIKFFFMVNNFLSKVNITNESQSDK